MSQLGSRAQLPLPADRLAEAHRPGAAAAATPRISETELARRLFEVAPDLAQDVERVGGVAMPERGGQPNRLPCAICAESMQPVFLGGIELDRCVRDRHAWFDTGELARVVAIAQRQHDQRTSLLLRVLSFLR